MARRGGVGASLQVAIKVRPLTERGESEVNESTQWGARLDAAKPCRHSATSSRLAGNQMSRVRMASDAHEVSLSGRKSIL